jgi:type IV pilus assembly protein PilA
MVVLLILAILMAIAIPTFLGVIGSANNRAAQSDLTNALTAATSFYQSNNQSFSVDANGVPDPEALASSLESSEPTFSWIVNGNCTSSSPNCISVDPSNDGTSVVLADYSKTNECWYVLYAPTESPATAFAGSSTTGSTTTGTLPNSPGTYFGETATSVGECSAANYASVTNWASTFGTVKKV